MRPFRAEPARRPTAVSATSDEDWATFARGGASDPAKAGVGAAGEASGLFRLSPPRGMV